MRIIFRFMLILFTLLLPKLSAANLSDAVKSFSDGKLEQGIGQCSDLVFSDLEPISRVRAYAMLALAYHLQNDEDAEIRIEGLLDLCVDSEGLDHSVLVPVLKYLSGTGDAAAMREAAAKSTPDWQAFAELCRYVMTLKTNPDPQVLYAVYQDYNKASSGLLKSDWAAAWHERLPQWQKFIQSGTAENKLEALILAKSPEEQKAALADDITSRIQSINQVIGLYLENQPQAANAARDAFNSLPPTDTAPRLILAYLKGDSVTQREIFQACQTSPPMWALGSLAMFVRDLAAARDASQLNQVNMLHHIDNFHGNLKLLKDYPDIIKWQAKTRVWEKWCLAKFAAMDGLDPLLAVKSGDAKSGGGQAVAAGGNIRPLSEVTIEEFTADRELFKDRPQPSGMELSDNELRRYLTSLPEDRRATEQRRARILFDPLDGMKHQLVRIMERNVYEGRIQTRRGTYNGTISMANMNILVYKKSSRSKPKRIRWEDLKLEQYITFMEHYAKQRQQMSGGQTSREERMFNAANDYLALAVLCDWFGEYEKALRYANSACELSPKISNSASRLMMD